MTNHEPVSDTTQDIFTHASLTLEDLQEKFHTSLSYGLSESDAKIILQKDGLKRDYGNAGQMV